jgi:hypothetical protein
MKKISVLFIAIVSLSIYSQKSFSQMATESETKAIFDLFWGAGASSGIDINDADIEKATTLFKELLEKSCEEDAIVSNVFTAPRLTNLAITIVRTSFTNCQNGTNDGKYYENVRKTIALKNKGAFETRKQTGEW